MDRLGRDLGGAFLAVGTFALRGLLSEANAKRLAGIDNGQPRGIITALETERLVLRAINMHALLRV
jgi:hypothetical protein